MDEQNGASIVELMQMLKDEEGFSVANLYGLSDLAPEELSLFCQSWNEFGDERKRIMIRHLADITEENFQVDFSEIFAFCLGDRLPAVRMAALDGLWDSERVTLIDPIVELMISDPEEDVRTLAAATIGHFILMAEWNQIPRRSVAPAVAALLLLLDDETTPAPVRRAALESLSPSSHERVSSLVEEAYDSGDQELQISAIYAMGRTVDKRWLPIVLDEMESSNDEMRLEAARAAGHIGSSEAVSELADLASDQDLEVRMAAVAALGQIGGSTATRILGEMDGDPDFVDVQSAIEEALEEMAWLGGEIDLSLLGWDNNQEDDRFLSV
ncbi:MAG: HEAT repeat domain-containing protein [Chloroflexota bacterium]|nr:MAG: HEAT repeat domain-containing protein [Chloroflexota bacterium]